MAKPIEPTPVLRGKDAEKFLQRFLQPPSKVRVRMIQEAKKSERYFDRMVKAW